MTLSASKEAVSPSITYSILFYLPLNGWRMKNKHKIWEKLQKHSEIQGQFSFENKSLSYFDIMEYFEEEISYFEKKFFP